MMFCYNIKSRWLVKVGWRVRSFTHQSTSQCFLQQTEIHYTHVQSTSKAKIFFKENKKTINHYFLILYLLQSADQFNLGRNSCCHFKDNIFLIIFVAEANHSGSRRPWVETDSYRHNTTAALLKTVRGFINVTFTENINTLIEDSYFRKKLHTLSV